MTYAPENLSARIARLLSTSFYLLQVCEEELVLLPFAAGLGGLKREVALEIPVTSIKSLEVTEYLLNYNIRIETDEDVLTLSVQQKELSDLRSSGLLASDWPTGGNWHKENLDATLELLKSL